MKLMIALALIMPSTLVCMDETSDDATRRVPIKSHQEWEKETASYVATIAAKTNACTTLQDIADVHSSIMNDAEKIAARSTVIDQEIRRNYLLHLTRFFNNPDKSDDITKKMKLIRVSMETAIATITSEKYQAERATDRERLANFLRQLPQQ